MKIRDAFRHGLSLVNHHRKMIGIIYLVNLCFALIVAAPLFTLFHSRVGSLVGRDELLTGLPYSWWSALQIDARGLENTIRPSLSGGFGPLIDNLELLLTGQFQLYGWFVFSLIVGYLFIAAFFNGGAIALFADERRSFSAGRFFSYAGTYFHHMAALAVTTVALFALLYKVINPAIFSLLDRIVGDSLSQSFAWIVHFIGYLFILTIVFLITLILDYAKVIVISEKKNSSWASIGLAAAFIFRSFGKTVGLNVLLAFLAIALVLGGGLLMSIITPSNLLLLVGSFIVQQLFIAAKIAVRLTFYASETALYQAHAAARTMVKKRKR